MATFHRFAVLMIVLASTSSCDQSAKPASKNDDLLASAQKSAATIEIAPSKKHHVKRRRARLLRNTIVKALDLDPDGYCMEFATIPCNGRELWMPNSVHYVNLGGMGAYFNSEYTHTDKISVTGPISLDRIVLSACNQRSGLDFSLRPNGKIFKGIEFSVDGRMVLSQAIDDSISRLYQRVLTREANAVEIAALKKLYEQIYEKDPFTASIKWMTLSCYAVMTSVEAAFY